MKKTERIRDLTVGNPLRLILIFALPLMLGNMFQQLYTIVDTAIVGKFVGNHALAALGSADWLNWFSFGVSQGFAQGFSILMSRYFGAKDYKQLNRSIGVSVTIGVILSILLLILCQLAAEPVLLLLKTKEEVLPDALIYLRIMYAGLPVTMGYNLLSAILRSMGDTKTPLYAIAVAALTNVGLDLLFVLVFHWGIAGAAVATVIAEVLSVVYCYLNLRKISIIRLTREDLKPTRDMLTQLLRLGLPVALQSGIIAIGGMAVQSVINIYDVLFVAGFTATNKLYGLLEIATTSYGYAVTSYMGQNLGSGKKERIHKGMRSAFFIALFTSVSIGGLMLLLGQQILSLFASGKPDEMATIIDVAYRYLSIMSVCLPILYMLHIYRSALMGLGNTTIPMLSGFSEMVLRVSVAMFLPKLIGQNGLFYAEVAAWTAAAIILVTAYYATIRRMGLHRTSAGKAECVK